MHGPREGESASAARRNANRAATKGTEPDSSDQDDDAFMSASRQGRPPALGYRVVIAPTTQVRYRPMSQMGASMRGWIASRPLRWFIFLLTTWCLNSDAIETVLTHGPARELSAAAVASAPTSITTIRAFHLPGSHHVHVRERCDCHRGTILPTGLAPVAVRFPPSFTAPLAAFADPLSVTAPPDLPPPRL